jgi:DNA-binding response OmpR family regulator
MKTILIIEDDLWISKSLKIYLENSWFEVFTYDTWEKAVETILDLKPDLVILDLNLPVKDWVEITKEVRNKSLIPIVMLTARDSDLDKIIWLEIWADDYIPKPFSPRVLLARINSILRRISETKKKKTIENKNTEEIWILKCWNYELNENKFIFKMNWKIVNLTKNEFDLMRKFIQAKWKTVSREDLMKDIWYNEYAFDRTIDTHIKNLRKKLWTKESILTIRWEWYRLNID